jgi:hypothetical protein
VEVCLFTSHATCTVAARSGATNPSAWARGSCPPGIVSADPDHVVVLIFENIPIPKTPIPKLTHPIPEKLKKSLLPNLEHDELAALIHFSRIVGEADSTVYWTMRFDAAIANQDWVEVTQASLADRIGIAKITVTRAIKKLLDLGIIEHAGEGFGRSTYYVTFPKG